MKRKIKLVAVIPAHLDSVRLKRKVLIDLFGIPMIEHVRRRVLSSKIFNSVLVISGDDEILNIVEKYGGETIRTYKNHLNGTSRVTEAARNLDCTHLVIVQGDEPLIQKEHLSRIAERIMKNPSGHAWNSISQLNSLRDLENKNIVKASINKEGKITYLFRKTPSIAEPTDQFIYIKKIQGLIAFRKDVLEKLSLLPESYGEKFESIEQLKIISYGFQLEGVMQNDQVPSINDENDLNEFFEYLKKNKSQNEMTKSILNK
tara:strand:- start:1096 stop:1875 length:780 start_codon:yes stop_codon:yes gene_type:complete